MGATYGDLFLLDNSELGVYAAVNYSNKWSKREDGERYTYESQGEIADNFLYRQYTNTIEASGLLSVGWNVGDSTRVEYRRVACNRKSAGAFDRARG